VSPDSRYLFARGQRGLRRVQLITLDPDLVRRFNEINTEPMSEDKATPEAAQSTLASEINRWAPIIKAAGEYAD
jgi:putative tricarboxylic transport membrane protein